MPGRVRSRRVQRASKQAIAALRSLSRSLEQMRSEIRTLAAAARRSRPGRPRRKRTLTPRARAFLKLQGRYLGLMRHLPKKHRSRIKDIKAKKGYEPAIRAALRLQS